MKQIVVGVDQSPQAAQALTWARREADLHGADVTAVLAWGLLNQTHLEDPDAFDPQYNAERAAAALAEIVRQGLGDAASTVEQRVVNDRPGPGILDVGQDADLIVVGARGLGGMRGALMGSVSQYVMNHADRPAAIIRPGEPESPRRVVVGVDGSDSGQAALRWAVEEAAARDAELDVVHVWDAPYPTTPHGPVVDMGSEQVEARAKQRLARILDSIDTASLRQPVNPILGHGSAAAVILDSARGAELVVLGSRGLGGFMGMLVGSVSQQVTHHAPCSVLIVRE